MRGLLEMAVAVGGTLWFCKTLFLIAGAMTEGATFLTALGDHAGTLAVSAAVVIGSWVSGFRYGQTILKG